MVLVVGALADASPSPQGAREDAEPVLTVLAKDALGRPLPDVPFRLREALARPPQAMRGTTDANGRGVLHVPSGWYVLTAEVPGLQAFVDTDVRLARGFPLEVVMTLQPSATMTGRSVDGAGRPVSAVYLSWVPADPTAPRFDWVGHPDGHFSVDGVGPGKGVLLARRKGYGSVRREFDARPSDLTVVLQEQGSLRVRAFDPAGQPVREPELVIKALDPVFKKGVWLDLDVVDARMHRGLEPGRYRVTFTHPLGTTLKWSVASEVAIERGQTRELELRFGEQARRPALKGRLVGHDGKALPGVEITAVAGDAAREGFESSEQVRTDEDGRFALKHLTPGAVRLSVASDEARLSYDTDARDVSLTWVGKPFMDGRVVDVKGRPITRFMMGGLPFEDAKGRFRYDLGGHGPLSMIIEAEGFARKRVRVDARAARVVIPDVVLAPGRTVRGQLVHKDGRPAKGPGLVRLMDTPEESIVAFDSVTRPVDAEGRFVLEHVPRERMFIKVTSDAGGTATVPLGADEDAVKVKLTPDAFVSGSVADATGRPLPGARVRLLCSVHRGAPLETDAEGRFQGRVRPGEPCVLKVDDASGPDDWPRAPQREFWPHAFEVRPGERVNVDLRPRSGPASVRASYPEHEVGPYSMLVPGDVPIPGSVREWDALGLTAIDADRGPSMSRPELFENTGTVIACGGGPTPNFSALPLGRYTLFVYSLGIGGETVLRYPLNLTTPGVHTLDARIPEKAGGVFLGR
jgi:hypothetical protein